MSQRVPTHRPPRFVAATPPPQPIGIPISTDGRLSAHRRGYGRRWKRIRDLHLAAEPFCRRCLASGKVTDATDVDHIVPRARGGSDDQANLQSLCHAHHSQKTAAEDRNPIR